MCCVKTINEFKGPNSSCCWLDARVQLTILKRIDMVELLLGEIKSTWSEKSKKLEIQTSYEHSKWINIIEYVLSEYEEGKYFKKKSY